MKLLISIIVIVVIVAILGYCSAAIPRIDVSLVSLPSLHPSARSSAPQPVPLLLSPYVPMSLRLSLPLSLSPSLPPSLPASPPQSFHPSVPPSLPLSISNALTSLRPADFNIPSLPHVYFQCTAVCKVAGAACTNCLNAKSMLINSYYQNSLNIIRNIGWFFIPVCQINWWTGHKYKDN